MLLALAVLLSVLVAFCFVTQNTDPVHDGLASNVSRYNLQLTLNHSNAMTTLCVCASYHCSDAVLASNT